MATMISTSDLSRGMILELDGNLYTILEYQGFKTGKGNSEARMRVRIRDIRSGFTQDRTFRTDERVPKASVESRPSQFLYNDGDLFHFMDTETYEQKLISRDALGPVAKYLTDGLAVEVLVHNEQPISVQLPINIDLDIADTDPGFKGDTAQADTKKATTTTGLLVDVPLFLNVGDTIRVDTRTGTYVARVS